MAAAVDRDIGFRYPVQIFNPHFDISFGCLVFGLRSLAFQKISLGFGLSFFIGSGMDCSFLRLRGVLPWICVELPLTAPLCQFRMVQAHFTNVAGWRNTVQLRSCGLYFKKTGIPYRLRLSNDTDYPTQAIQFFKQSKLLTIRLSYTGYPVFQTA